MCFPTSMETVTMEPGHSGVLKSWPHSSTASVSGSALLRHGSAPPSAGWWHPQPLPRCQSHCSAGLWHWPGCIRSCKFVHDHHAPTSGKNSSAAAAPEGPGTCFQAPQTLFTYMQTKHGKCFAFSLALLNNNTLILVKDVHQVQNQNHFLIRINFSFRYISEEQAEQSEEMQMGMRLSLWVCSRLFF